MNDIQDFFLNMCIAAYLHKDPDTQVRRMAKRYKKSTNDKATQRTLRVIIKSPQPSKVVKVAYDELTSEMD